MQTLNGNWKLTLDPKNEGRAGQWFAVVRPEARREREQDESKETT